MDARPEHLARLVLDVARDSSESVLLTLLLLIRDGSLGDILDEHDPEIAAITDLEDRAGDNYPYLYGYATERAKRSLKRELLDG